MGSLSEQLYSNSFFSNFKGRTLRRRCIDTLNAAIRSRTSSWELHPESWSPYVSLINRMIEEYQEVLDQEKESKEERDKSKEKRKRTEEKTTDVRRRICPVLNDSTPPKTTVSLTSPNFNSPGVSGIVPVEPDLRTGSSEKEVNTETSRRVAKR